MYYVQNAMTGSVLHCPTNEAWFWAKINDIFFHTLSYNVYEQGGSMRSLWHTEIR